MLIQTQIAPYFAMQSPDVVAFEPQATEIIPRVYIADLFTAQSRSKLIALGITHVLSAHRGRIELPTDLGLQTYQVAIEDMPFADLLPHLPQTTSFIRLALASSPNARVLIHCAKGVSRSASIVAAYLVAVYGWTVPQAIEHIKAKRRIALPNLGFVMQLEEYAIQLRSKDARR